MNQDHGSASYSRKRIDLPPPRSLTTRLVPVEVDLKQQRCLLLLQQRSSPKGRFTSTLCQERTCSDPYRLSAKAESRRTHSITLVGAGEKRWWDVDTEPFWTPNSFTRPSFAGTGRGEPVPRQPSAGSARDNPTVRYGRILI